MSEGVVLNETERDGPPAPADSPAAATGGIVVGKVASPPPRESTSERFFFWIEDGLMVEKTQIVRTESVVTEGEPPVRFYAIVTEVYRQSRHKSMGEERDRHDGDSAYEPPFGSGGFTYAEATILRTDPPVMAPPFEESKVYLGDDADAAMAYSADENGDPLPVGLIKNGSKRTAGAGQIDLEYLLGVNGGGLNVNGVSGRGTKSSFLLHCNYLLLAEAQRRARDFPGDPDRLRLVPIILNVKNFDLFHIDRRSTRYRAEEHAADWRALGIDQPGPFTDVTYYARQEARGTTPVSTGRPRNDVKAFSWSLSNIIEDGLLPYLFAEEDVNDANFGALLLDLENRLTIERYENDGTRRRTLATENGLPQDFRGFLEWLGRPEDQGGPRRVPHAPMTWMKLFRRVQRLVFQSNGLLRREDAGQPLRVAATDARGPIVIDLSALATMSALQRFVVATIFHQLREDRTGARAQRGLVYLVTLDELNRFAPRGSRDPITHLIEQVAAEMRSQGIILLGAQQQASLVSTRITENAGIRALGKSGSVELSDPVWRFLSDAARRKATTLRPDEKLLIQDNFREPMYVKIPFPPWALNPREATDEPAPGRRRGGLDDA